MDSSESPIGDLVREAENNYVNGTTQVSQYVSKSMYDDLNTIDAYLNSRHISGEKDYQDLDKPFFNICIAAANIWYRATDIDRKDIRFKANKQSDYLLSFLATAKLQEFMRKEQFGTFLNDWGLKLARYGSSVVKFIENSTGLHKMVVAWNRLIVDTIDFDNNPVIEILELTPAQLRQNESYDQELVEKLIESKTTRKTIGKQQKDTKDNYIKLYEVHGKLPKSYLTGKDKDEKEYVQQMQVISFVAKKDKGTFDDYVLVKAKEKQSPYMITHLIQEEGQTLAIGAVQHLFQAQWMTNHSIKAIKDQLDLASKLIFQTADANYANKNVISNIENGAILTYMENMPLTQIANNSHDISSLQSFAEQWRGLAQEITSTPDLLEGKNLPSGTAYRQAAIIQQESHSNFEIMTENKGLYIETMFREFIIPYLKKQLNTKDEIMATLDDYGITEIDQHFIPSEAARRFNKKAVEAVINRTQLPNLQQETQGVIGELNTGVRFFKPSEADDMTWKELMKDFDWDSLEVEVTGEQADKQAILATLDKVFTTLASNPGILQDENAKMIFNQILETTGNISSLQLKKPAMPQPPQLPQAGATGQAPQVTQGVPVGAGQAQ